MTIKSWLKQATSSLASSEILSAQLDAELLLAHTLHESRTWLLAHADDELSKSQIEAANHGLQARIKHLPVAYITGVKEFYGREFIVTPDTLIPRPETETLVEYVVHLAPKSILDVGCGSGCTGLTLQAELPNAEVTLSDISDRALEVAKKNALALSITPKGFEKSDLLTNWLEKTTRKHFDVITANLPYVDETWEVSADTFHEPSLALYADDGGLALIKKLIQQALSALSSGGILALEADPRQFEDIRAYARMHTFTVVYEAGYCIALQLD